MGVALALGAALAYGVADFAGGFLSRRTPAIAVAFYSQVAAAVLVVLLALLADVYWPSTPTVAALGWGAVSGVGAGVGLTLLYRGLAAGRMSQVSPASAMTSAILPVFVAAGLGERVSTIAIAGISVAVPAIVLVTRSPSAGSSDGWCHGGTVRLSSGRWRLASGVRDGVIAGIGFAVGFVALARIPEGTGLWPIAVAEVASVPIVILLAAVTRTSMRVSISMMPSLAVVGAVAAGALVLYLYSTRVESLSVVVVVTSLYPAITVLLAALLIGERIRRDQWTGLACAALAVTLLALG